MHTCTLRIGRILLIVRIAPIVLIIHITLVGLSNYTIKDGCLYINLDASIYSKNAIAKCLYWYSKDFLVDNKLDNDQYIIALQPKNDNIDLEQTKEKINQDLNDFNLRDIVAKETTTIRELITAKAFSHGEYDEDPPGDMNDPIGVKFI